MYHNAKYGLANEFHNANEKELYKNYINIISLVIK